MQLSAVDKIISHLRGASVEYYARSQTTDNASAISHIFKRKNAIENDFEKTFYFSRQPRTHAMRLFFYSFDVRHKGIKTFHKKHFFSLSISLCSVTLFS